MPGTTPSLIARNDTILGVCEALGQDFGFHPNILRVVLAASFYFSPLLVTSAYLGLGLVVAASRWAFPATIDEPAATGPTEAISANEERREAMPLAA